MFIPVGAQRSSATSGDLRPIFTEHADDCGPSIPAQHLLEVEDDVNSE